ncbi:esterase-like activity of phytase family protein [Herbiconiux sp. CPCC 205763]|uniref:Esterase-like activity of phytase family protein n=1 Tax=Herbiconiux aconitum TaxID=2970913 RepID=A0ABT2GTU9_9MICO|nr:esterase-like activity of phytase family protein [Herbiconiux aconitum]MCS5719603.1 esterase-like activity of phytase family protein [Herbiconiux aconitum]
MTRRIRVAPAARTTAALAVAGALAGVCLLGAQPALAAAPTDSAPSGSGASVTPGGELSANAFGTNEGYAHAVISHTEPANGTLSIGPNGDYSYTPKAGFIGTDSFTVSSSDAVKLYTTGGADLGVFGGVPVTGNGYGSSVVAVPGKPGFVYGLTDRGPNVDGADGVKVEPLPDFTPSIGEFQLVGGQAVLVRDIPLKDADGSPLNGQVSTEATTGETIVDLDGNPLPPSPYGFDSEGLVAMPDGTFYVSDEYGPYIAHFDADGKRLGQFSPFDGSLPQELRNRTANQGMEGLTITPDGTSLVGLMQSALKQPDLGSVNAKKVPATRIVTISLIDQSVHEYLYLTTDPATTADASSEITALSATKFLVLERDGNLPPAPNRKLIYQVDISGATDVGPDSTLADSTYDAANGGLLLDDQGGQTIESFVGAVTTDAAQAALTARGITPGAKSDYLNLTDTLAELSPEGTFFGHDKVEGVFPIDGGSKLFISNDSDFGLKGTVADATSPFVLDPKINADGTQDQGEYLEVDLTKLPATQTVTTVTITVAAAVVPADPGSPTAGSGSGTGGKGALAATGAAPAPALVLATLALLLGAATLAPAALRRRMAR